jgi:Ca2+-binding EF-hand superfamily protein
VLLGQHNEGGIEMNVKSVLGIVIFVMLLPYTGWADELSSENEKLFREFDQNKDNVISIDEANKNQWLFEQFSKIDKNRDEKLEKSEFSAYEPESRFEPPDQEPPNVGAAPLDE